MKKSFQSITLTTGLAIFAMLFGAGNLIFPLKAGILSGTKVSIGLIAFLLSGVILPLAGLIGLVLFNGDYRAFFYRIGKTPGAFFIFFCMLIIGPLLVMPRIVCLTYELLRPFIGSTISILPFSIFFTILTFISCYKKDSIVSLLGNILSPLMLAALFIMIIVGTITGKAALVSSDTFAQVFIKNLLLGYNTLDLLGSIFFAYIVLEILRDTLDQKTATNPRAIARIVFRASCIGGFLLAVIYIGMGILGAFHGQGLGNLDAGKAFITTMTRVMGSYGALFITIAVFAACLSTIIALASVVTEYLRNDIVKNKVNYVTLLIGVLGTTIIVSQLELGKLLYYSEPFINIAYPVLIVLTACNIAYKLWNFKYIKAPVLATLILSTFWFGPELIRTLKNRPDCVECVGCPDSPVQQ